MRARMLAVAALVALMGCDVEEPRTPDDMRQRGVYPLPASAESDVQAQPQQGEPQQGQSQAQQQDGKPEPVWPKRFARGETAYATYEPQFDSWENEKVSARAPVEIFPPGATAPKYGIVWFEARTVTDRDRNQVTFEDVRVTRVSFPTAKEREPEILEAMRGAQLVEAKTVAMDRLRAQVAYGKTHQPVPARTVKNDPPAILVSNRPLVLVVVDGAPQLRDEGNGVQRVINTRALVMSDRTGATYVFAGDRWFRASSLDGPYVEAQGVPPEVDAVKKRLEGSPTIDLFATATDRVRQGASVVVTTKPTEVIETRGAPAYESIAGTNLSYVSNTESDVIRDETTKQTYVLLAGRWFRAPSLDGPWTHVPAKEMPAAFRSIPKDHREARVLASIPGTPEAEEAVIAASVPQTATVDRSQVRVSIPYDGHPDFRPVEGASGPLRYAVNSPTPVLETGDGMYYAVENGVWFVSASPTGPWTVATSVPDVIYSIPPSSPIHYVTYVRIYGYSPEYAYVGYTPGYMGAIYTDGVVVWGTGYRYRPWIGSVWYGYPSTWGFGVGFGFRPPVVAVGRPYPWWGPTRFWLPGYGYGGYGSLGIGRANVYQHWSPRIVHAPPAHARVAPRVLAPPAYGGVPRASAPPAYGGAPRVYAPAAPRVGAPPAYGGAPRVYSPSAPRVGAPPAYGGAPRVYSAPAPGVGASPAPRVYAPPAPMAPRISAPPAPMAPRISAPPAGFGGGAVRSAPPAGGGPRISAPPARRR